MSDAVETSGVAVNTDCELWREPSMPPGMEYYAPSIHVTEGGGIGIDVGGIVFVKPLREWHRLAMVDSAPETITMKPEGIPDDIWETAQAVARTIPDLDAEIKIAPALLAERLKERELCAVTGGDAIIQKHPILAQMVRNAIRSRP